jgi:hypothetical protein
MAERLLPLPASQVARVKSPDLARPTISVEKLAFFCNPVPGGHVASTAIALYSYIKKSVAKAKVFPHLESWVRIGSGIPHVKGHNSLLRRRNSKE